MELLAWTAYLTLALLALGQAALLALQTWEHRRYARSCTRRLGDPKASGRAAVLAPCKGLDVSMAENLRALFCQDYADYELVFIVESDDDPAVAVIRRAMAEHPAIDARIVVAGRATDCGQKVHNLRAGTAGLSQQIEYLAFVDSDAGPRPEWLRTLVARLAESDKIAAVTGYRWLLPERPTLANCLLYSINGGVMALFGRSSHYLVWGGSWGIRREAFEAIGLRQAWAGTLSDDLVATRALRRAGRRVRFEPGCVVGSPVDYALADVFRFVRRQYLVGRYYTPGWWLFGLAATTLSALAWLGNLAAIAAAWAYGLLPLWLTIGVTAVLYALSVGRGWLRQSLIEMYFPGKRGRESFLQSTIRAAPEKDSRPLFLFARFDVWANPLGALAGWLGVLGSLVGRRITWRGISYRMLPGGRIGAVEHRDAPAPPADDHKTHRPAAYRKAG